MWSVYQDLDATRPQIRLLSVDQAEASDDFTCTLQTFDISSAPSYKALSYAWGSPDRKHEIRVNGSQVQISDNLFEFLQVYKKRSDRGLIWIDQLCINQGDVKEKGHQIRMMHQIYRNADLTLIWLGADHQRVLPFTALTKQWKQLEDWMYLVELDDVSNHLSPWNSSVGQLAQAAWQFLTGLPYWKRHWILQEVTLSPSKLLLFGQEEFAWRRFTSMTYCAPAPRSALILSIVGTGNMYEYEIDMPNADMYNHTIWEYVMDHASNSTCSDPRDKVFGSQSILHKSLRVEPDYTLPVRDVFLKTVELRFCDTTYSWRSPNTINLLSKCSGLARGMGFTDSAIIAKQDCLDYLAAQRRLMQWADYWKADATGEISWQKFREVLEQDLLTDQVH